MEEIEYCNPVDYVAPEIWAIIFEKLQSHQAYENSDTQTLISCGRDILNCSRVCITFRNVLEQSKCLWLFPEVFPLIFPYLTGTELLLCREVCKTWSHSANKFLENEQHHLRKHLDYLRNHSNWENSANNSYLAAGMQPLSSQWNASVQDATYSFTKSANIIGFLNDMQNTRGNPFPGKTLRLQYHSYYGNVTNNDRNEEYDRHNQFWRLNVFQLLSIFGQCLSIFEIFIDFNPRFSPSNFYSLLLSYLEMTPNLKRLIIKSVSGEYMNAISASTLAEEIADNCNAHLPPLECLESLEFSPGTRFLEYSSLPLCIQQRVGNPYLNQLKRLYISFADGGGLMPLWRSENMPNLEELKVELFSVTQLNSILPPNAYFKRLRSIIIVITAYYDVSLLASRKKECQWQPQLGEFLEPLKNYKSHLTELVLDADRSPWGVASQNALDELREFDGLKYLHINNFWFPQLRVLECIPASVKVLRLSGYFSCGYHRIFRKLHIPADLLCLQEKSESNL